MSQLSNSIYKIRLVVRNVWANIVSRTPSMETADMHDIWCWRLYGIFRSRKGFAIIDWTETRLYHHKPSHRRLRVFGWTMYERNEQYSGYAQNN